MGVHPPPRRLPSAAWGFPCHQAAWVRGPPPRSPFGLFLPLDEEIPEENPVTQKSLLFRRRRDFDLGIARRPCPGTLPEGGLTSGGLSTTMLSSGMRHE